MDRSSVDKISIYLYLHYEEKDGTVEGKEFLTKCNLISSTRKKGRGSMVTDLETSYLESGTRRAGSE